MFITFEGIEGSGKTTQIKLLKKALLKKGCSIVVTREPGGTSIGNQIRTILLKNQNKNLKPLTELFLYVASRAQHVEEKILPALKKGHIIISDRFHDASTVYQGVARKLSTKLTKKLNSAATHGLKPNLTFILDCPAKLGLKRIQKRCLDRIEREKISFHKKIRSGYLKLAKEEPMRVKILDGTQSIDIIHKEVLKLTLKKL